MPVEALNCCPVRSVEPIGMDPVVNVFVRGRTIVRTGDWRGCDAGVGCWLPVFSGKVDTAIVGLWETRLEVALMLGPIA